MKKQFDIKKLVLLNLPYLLMGLFTTNFGEAWRLAQGANASEKFLSLFAVLPGALQSFWPSLHPLDLLVGLCCGAGLRLAVYLKSKNAKKYRHGMEYGSARWGTREDIAPYIDPVFQNNVILTKTESLTMNSRPKDPKTARNKNVLVIGGSGSGKTRFWLKPNLMQMHSSYVVTDPKGTILVECGKMLQRGAPKLGKDGKPMKDKHGKVIYEPYRIKVLNTINFRKSMHYNPFAYIHSEKDILKLVTTLIANTKGEGKAGDDFWVKAETLLYCALIGYIHYEAPVEEQNFSTLIEFINAMEVREDDEEFKNPVDLMFDALESEKPNHFAVRQYKKYKLAAGKTAKSILISCGARLAVFDIAELREVTSYDELELDTLGDRKTALFLIMSDTDDSFNFLISMCYTQLFNLLCEKADDVYGGRLPVHVRCLIDECANIGQIPKLEKLVATIRSREISASQRIQFQLIVGCNLAQLCNIKYGQTRTTGNQDRLSGFACRQLIFLILPHCEVVWLFRFQCIKHQVYRIFELLVILPDFHGVDELDEGGEVLLLHRSFIVDISDQCAIQQCFRLDPEIVSGLALAFGISDQRCHQLQNILFRVDVCKGVIVHGLLEVDGI